jgi:hypothetical protein
MSIGIDAVLKEGIKKFNKHSYIFEKREGNYVSHTYNEFYEDVLRFSSFFCERGLKNKKIALYASNSYSYMVTDIAVMAYTGILLALAEHWNVEDLENIIRDIGFDALVYEKSKEVIVNKLREKYKNIDFISLEELENSKGKAFFDGSLRDTKACSKIVFSSGTTGDPKAVMLSQKNMFANADNLFKRAAMDKSDICYLFLPLSHTYGGIGNFLYSLISGMRIYLCSDKTEIMEEIRQVKPSLFCAVPLVLKKVYRYSLEQGVAVKEVLGGNIKYLFCGGAFLEPEIRKYIKDEGVNLLEAYGLSETTSLISLEYSYNKDDFTSVGSIFENQSVRIAKPDENGVGEITVKGDNIFVGYCNREDLYAAAFDKDGYFHTGDLGYVKDNKLYLAGRKKRLIVRDNARNIYPDELEKILADKLKADAVKIFEKQGRLHCSVYSNTLSYSDNFLETINSHLPKYCRMDSCELVKNNLSTKLK